MLTLFVSIRLDGRAERMAASKLIGETARGKWLCASAPVSAVCMCVTLYL